MILENPSLYFETKASEANIRIDDLCDAAGLARSTFTRWKSKKNGATFASIKKLQVALDKLSSPRNNGKAMPRCIKSCAQVK
jgi:hypothetical protein